MKLNSLTALILFSVIGLVSCSSTAKMTSDSATNLTESSTTTVLSAFSNGNVWTTEDGTEYFTCPVMGGDGKVTEAPAYSDFKGIRVYHCCPPCQGPFRSNPDRYLSGLALPENVTSVTSAGSKIFRDPINGTTGEVTDDTYYFDYNNRRYFFAEKKTLKMFKKSPQDHIAATNG